MKQALLNKLDPPPKGSCRFHGKHRTRLGVRRFCIDCGWSTESPVSRIWLFLAVFGLWSNVALLIAILFFG